MISAPLPRPARSPRSAARSVLSTGALLGAAAFLLTGCVQGAGPVGPTDGASGTPSPSATLPPTELPDLGEPGPDCATILTAEDLYAFDPNLGAVGAPAPADGSLGADAAALDGTLCRWVNATSGLPVDVAVAVPGDDALAERSATAEADATPAESLASPPDVTAYFDVADGVGTVQVFAGGRWIVLTSPVFVEARDAEPLVRTVLANLASE